jgi:predicted flavoprotein YhiN
MTNLATPHKFDVVIIGAGAAGLFCAGLAGHAGLKVLIIDHSEKVAEKIRISGGGRANFTNKDVSPANFLSENPHFCRSALSRYTPRDFIALMDKHGVSHHEKHKGQLFCDNSAQDLIDMLLKECAAGDVQRWQPCEVQSIRHIAAETALKAPHLSHSDDLTDLKHKNGSSRRINCLYCYEINSNKGLIRAANVVIATGGLSIPKIGATDFGYRIAKQFNLRLVEPRPALVPLTFDGDAWLPYSSLAGLALPVVIETGTKKSKANEKAAFSEDLLFTHKGLSGPAVLQISSFWRENGTIKLNLAPNTDVLALLQQSKARSHKLVANELANLVPSRLADAWTSTDTTLQRPMSDVPDKALTQLAQRLSNWELTPTGTEGYKKAEVTLGGVDTRDVSSQTMESKQPGLYFIGEVLDVTGWLGGYNFQWAWASGFACAQGLIQGMKDKLITPNPDPSIPS